MSDPLLGEIKLFAGNFAPKGWAFCAGQVLPISQYAAMFSILGTTYGGNGTSNFQLPDLRGRVAVGQGQGNSLSDIVLGEMAGAASATLLTSNMPSHSHTVKVNGDTNGMTATVAGNYLNGKTESGESVASTGPTLTTLNAATVGLTGSNLPFSIMPPYLGLNYIIAMAGVFPTRN